MSTPFAADPMFFVFNSGDDDGHARIAGLPNGLVAVVSVEQGDVPHLQLLNADHTIISVQPTAGDSDSLPSVAALANGNLVIGWSDSGSGLNGFRIYTQQGVIVGSASFSGQTADIRVIGLANGNFVATRAVDGDFLFQVYSPLGIAIGAEQTLLSGADAFSDPEITALADGGFVIGGVSSANAGDPVNFIRNADGSFRTSSPPSLSVTTESQTFVLGLANGNFVSVLTNEGGVDGSGNGILAVIQQADGTPLPSPLFFVNTITSGDQDQPAGVGLSDGGFVIAWTDHSVSTEVHAQAFNADGSKRGFEFVVGGGSDASVTQLADGRIMFTWTRPNGFDDDIVGRIFDARETAITLNGTTLDDQWIGSVYADLLAGQGGNDTVAGGGGDDTISGGAGNDTLKGDNGNDIISGGAGGDQLTGGAGFDQLDGGAGDDLYLVDALDTITETAAGGHDTVFTSVAVNLAVTGGGFVEDVAALGTDAIALGGNAGNNVLSGFLNSAGNALSGGNGSDTYSVDALDTVVEAAGAAGGIDTILSALANVDLATAQHGNGNVENARAMAASTISLSGNGLGNTLNGEASSGANSLLGRGGNDIYVIGVGDMVSEAGGSGIDTVQSGTRALSLAAFAGVENATLTGSTGLALTGTGAANVLVGNAGTNLIAGHGGRDTMTGGGARDIFDFDAVAETGKTAATRDIIKDFTHALDDIDLATIDANGAAAGSTAFTFLSTKGAAFTGLRGQLHWFQQNFAGTANDKTIIEGDINGDKLADFQIELGGLKTLTSGDFVL